MGKHDIVVVQTNRHYNKGVYIKHHRDPGIEKTKPGIQSRDKTHRDPGIPGFPGLKTLHTLHVFCSN